MADLTVEELERLVESTVRRTIEDYLEDLEALSSRTYVESIREARDEYGRHDVTKLADLENE